MRTYFQNGTATDMNHILSDTEEFSIQCETIHNQDIIYYSNDTLVREIDVELVDIYDKFRDLYFQDVNLYYNEISMMPSALYMGGLSSEVPIDKNEFLKLKNNYSTIVPNLEKHIYVNDCQYLVSTVQNLIQSIEYCFVHYFIQISQIHLPEEFLSKDDTYHVGSSKSMQLMFFIETFFTKIYSVLDLMVKIIYELEKPIASFESILKLKSSDKLWGDRKKISINHSPNTIFEDCEIIRQIESLRNEAVHNGTWEFRPRVFLKTCNRQITSRYMLFPDFEDGRLSTVKNRKHFFSTEIKINDALVNIHDEFYHRLLSTLKLVNGHQKNNIQTDL